MINKISLIFLVVILLLLLVIDNTEYFINNNIKWEGYRLGDIVKYWDSPENYINSIKHKYPGSIGDLYIKLNPTKKINLKLLYQIIDDKSKHIKKENLPSKNDFILHLRIGDSITEYKNGKFVYNYRILNNTSYATKIENIKKNIKHMKNKNVILVYGNHQPDNIESTKINKLYLKNVKQILRNNNIIFTELNSKNPDTDFLYMCNSKYFGQSGGGYSKLIADYVKHKGNRVINFIL